MTVPTMASDINHYHIAGFSRVQPLIYHPAWAIHLPKRRKSKIFILLSFPARKSAGFQGKDANLEEMALPFARNKQGGCGCSRPAIFMFYAMTVSAMERDLPLISQSRMSATCSHLAVSARTSPIQEVSSARSLQSSSSPK